MTLDITGVVVFLLAVMPGFVAQQSRHSLVPRPLESKTALEETGDYVLNSFFVHLFSLLFFHEYLARFKPQCLLSFGEAVLSHSLFIWTYDHRYLALGYLCFTLIGGFALGLFRGYLALNQPVRNKLAHRPWFRGILERLHIPSFIEEGPVWYDVLREQQTGELTFMQVKMKSGCFYTGELERYGILKDSEKNKDLFLVNVYFRGSSLAPYETMACRGVLLNFSEIEAIEVIKQIAPGNETSTALLPGS
jgi:Family of unknown function (DUF6338)